MQQILDTARKIRNMEVRGAGRIARAAAEALMDYALSLDAQSLDEFNSKSEKLQKSF
jgi:ribose 1,5-bisphosphate isomerase